MPGAFENVQHNPIEPEPPDPTAGLSPEEKAAAERVAAEQKAAAIKAAADKAVADKIAADSALAEKAAADKAKRRHDVPEQTHKARG